MLNRLAGLLSESTMGFLALAALSLGLAPDLLPVPPGVEHGFDVAQWLIVALFALEYGVNLALAGDRRKYMLDPWRILDIAIIAVPLLLVFPALFPFLPDALRTTPALRILRLLRTLLFGPIVGHGIRRTMLAPPRAAPDGPPRVTMLQAGDSAPRPCTWDELLQWAKAPTSAWMQASNLAPAELAAIAAAASVPHVRIEAALHESSYPRIESGSHWTALTVSLPSLGETIQRDPVLLLVSEHAILSLAQHALDLPPPPSPSVPVETADSADLPWGPRCALNVVQLVLSRDEELAGRLERMVRHFEDLPVMESSEDFFRDTIRLKRVLSTVKGDLWRLRAMLEMIGDGRRQLPGLDAGQREQFTPLADEADYLYETVDNVRESVLSLIELHIDIAGHSTTRFMRLMAIVSTLALIPAVMGGLLGMNLSEAPFPVTLAQVAYGALVLTLAVLYIFMAKGWLR